MFYNLTTTINLLPMKSWELFSAALNGTKRRRKDVLEITFVKNSLKGAHTHTHTLELRSQIPSHTHKEEKNRKTWTETKHEDWSHQCIFVVAPHRQLSTFFIIHNQWKTSEPSFWTRWRGIAPLGPQESTEFWEHVYYLQKPLSSNQL